MRSSKRSSIRRAALSFAIAAVLLCAGVLGFIYRQDIQDTIEGASFQPTPAVASIEQRVGLTPAGTRIFHATTPSVVGADSFNASCPRQESASPIMGCYTPQDAIFIYDVENQKLDGIKEVTAVHELLHAVWARLSAAERESLGAELQQVYEKNADTKLRQRMAYYQRTESGQEKNELHSILATEMPQLSDRLERHYAKYFDRQSVVALYEKYQTQYETLERRVVALQETMATLAENTQAQSREYNNSRAQLEGDIRNFNTRAQSGAFSSQASFNQERQRLVARGDALEVQRISINKSIDEYNAQYDEYVRVAGEIQLLNSSMDSMKELEAVPQVERL